MKLIAEWILLILMIGNVLAAEAGECPRGQVWGGRKCELLELCPDGEAPVNGRCGSDETPPTRAALCPEGTVSVGGGKCRQVDARPPALPPAPVLPPPTPPCQSGKVLINGHCSFAVRECDSQTVFVEQRGESRSVVFVGGGLASLFNRYMADLKVRDLHVDLDRLRVIFIDSQGRRVILRGGDDVKMGIGDLFSGMTMRQVWVRKLKTIGTALDLTDPALEARQTGADFICAPRD